MNERPKIGELLVHAKAITSVQLSAALAEQQRYGNALGTTDVATVRVGVDTPALDAWRVMCDVGESGALLVRPDHHVAWRARTSAQSPDLSPALDVLAGRSLERHNTERTS